MRIAMLTLTAIVGSLIGLTSSTAGENEPKPVDIPAPLTEKSEFELLVKAIQDQPGHAKEEDILRLLKMGVEQTKPFAASIALESWLGNHLSPSARVWAAAAENAFLIGKFDVASERYRKQLEKVQGTEEAGVAAANYLRTMIDYAGKEEDAYQYMASSLIGVIGPEINRFTGWFCRKARARNDLMSLSLRLRKLMESNIPLAVERAFLWNEIEHLFQSIRFPNKDHMLAIGDIKWLAAHLREDPARVARYNFYLANYDYIGLVVKAANAAGVEMGTLLAAAKAYLTAAPNGATLKDIAQIFIRRNDGPDDLWWRNPSRLLMMKFLSDGIVAIGAANSDDFFNWKFGERRAVWTIGSVSEWIAQGARDMRFFDDGILQTPLTISKENVSQLVSIVKEEHTLFAAAIRALAVGDSLEAVFGHLCAKELYWMPPESWYPMFTSVIWPSWKSVISGGDPAKVPDDSVYFMAMAKVGDAYFLGKAPVFINQSVLAMYLDALWKANVADMNTVASKINSLKWVPYNEERESRDRMGQVLREMEAMYQTLCDKRRQPPTEKVVLDSFLVAVTAMRDLLTSRSADIETAVDPLAKALAKSHKALLAKDQKQFLAAAEDARLIVNNYMENKTPGGKGIVRWFVRVQGPGWDVFDVQIKFLSDLSQTYGKEKPNDGIIDAFVHFFDARDRWRWCNNAPVQARPQALKVNAALRMIVEKQIADGVLTDWAFGWWRATRQGERWRDDDNGVDLLEKMIAGDVFGKTGYRVAPASSATVTAMIIVRNEFHKLQARFGLESGFDDYFVAECQKTKQLDWQYWEQGGRDLQRKVIGAASEILLGFERPPFAFSGMKFKMDEREWNDWVKKIIELNDDTRAGAFISALEKKTDSYVMPYAVGSARFIRARKLDMAESRAKLVSDLDHLAKTAHLRFDRDVIPAFIGIETIKSGSSLSDEEINKTERFLIQFTPSNWRVPGIDRMTMLLMENLIAKNRSENIMRITPEAWRIAIQFPELRAQFIDLATKCKNSSKAELAGAIAQVGLVVCKSALEKGQMTSLENVINDTRIDMQIPVDVGHPHYKIYVSKNSFFQNLPQSAWDEYSSGSKVVSEMIGAGKLPASYVLWIIEKHIILGQITEGEKVRQALVTWFDKAKTSSAEERAKLDSLSADALFRQGNYPAARAEYLRIARTDDYSGTKARFMAEVGVANVDRVTKSYSAAEEILTKMIKRENVDEQNEARYVMALTKVDQNQLKDAMQLLIEVTTSNPDHNNAQLLLAEVRLKLLTFDVDIDVGGKDSRGRKILTPGDPIKFKIIDANRVLVQKNQNVELKVWTEKSKDEQLVTLLPRGDSQEAFSGKIETELAAVVPNDNKLQVLGGDIIHIALSEGFLSKLENPKQSNLEATIVVVTSSELFISSGKLLSKEDLRKKQEEERIKTKLGLAVKSVETGVLSEQRLSSQLRPGNLVQVMVEDQDQSVSSGCDKIVVDVMASSGDVIRNVALEETEPFSGVFTGQIKTALRPASASASDSGQACDPNAVISPSADLPAWIGKDGVKSYRTFTVDMNDLVSMGKMSIIGGDKERLIQSMLIQTSKNNLNFHTIGSWPKEFVPWDGSVETTITGLASQEAVGASNSSMLQNLVDVSYYNRFKQQRWSFKPSTKNLKIDYIMDCKKYLEELIKSKVDPTEQVQAIIRTRGAFYVNARSKRLLTLEVPALPAEISKDPGALRYLPKNFLFIDGKPVVPPVETVKEDGSKEEFDPRFAYEFSKGVHVIEIYTIGAPNYIEFTLPIFTMDNQAEKDEDSKQQIPSPELFGPDANPRIAEIIAPNKVAVKQGPSPDVIDIDFGGLESRIIRIVINEYTGQAPQIRKITLASESGKSLLPIAQDYIALRQNDILEVGSGDKVTVTYSDPSVISKDEEKREASLACTYFNGRVGGAFLEVHQKGVESVESLIDLRRWTLGDTLVATVSDADLDVTPEPDKVKVTISTSEEKRIELELLETGSSTGAFQATFWPVEAQPSKPGEIQVTKGDDIYLSYKDMQNLDEGVPTTRQAILEQVFWKNPTMHVYSTRVEEVKDKIIAKTKAKGGEVDPARKVAVADGNKKIDEEDEASGDKPLELIMKRPGQPTVMEQPSVFVLGGSIVADVVFPTIAKSTQSKTTLYVQTSSGRTKSKIPLETPFSDDLMKVPGTIALTSGPSAGAVGILPTGITLSRFEKEKGLLPELLESPLDRGQFAFNVPFKLGECPDQSFVPGCYDGPPPDAADVCLRLNAKETIFFGYKWQDQQGKTQWFSGQAKMTGVGFFRVTQRDFDKPLNATYVGENIYFKVVDLSKDETSERDKVTISVMNGDGKSTDVQIHETTPHSGEFRGLATLVHKDDPEIKNVINAIPTKFGDSLEITYKATSGNITRHARVYRGSNGTIIPFSKRFEDQELAIKTQFAIAEAYFELAQKHRELAKDATKRENQEEAEKMTKFARDEIREGKRILIDAIRDFPDTSLRAQADFLVAKLEFELGQHSINEEEQKKNWSVAVNLFTQVLSNYPDSDFAAQAQYLKALCYDKLEDMDKASEEYVRLAFKFPKHPKVADAIIRLGRYNLTLGYKYDKKAKKASETDPVEGEKLAEISRKHFKIAGSVLEKLPANFPSHELAQKTLVLAGFAFKSADEFERAVVA